MFLADCHMHSAISFDSQTPRAEMARAAAAQGLSYVCFTDHYDVIDEGGAFVPAFDWPAVRAEHQAALQARTGVELGYGLEMGNIHGGSAVADAVLAEPGLDFVIGSVHNTGQALGYLDYYAVHYTPQLCALHLQDYFDRMLELVEWGHFDSLGHLPYPLRYMRDRDRCDVTLRPYTDQITLILRKIIAAGQALEVNTKQFHNSRADYAALLDLYRSLGGELVTCGADAHRPNGVGDGIADAYSLLREKNFRYVTLYRGRKPVPIRL